jgi:hypothetical protein
MNVVLNTIDNQFLFIGGTYPSHGSSINKVSATGNPVWNKNYFITGKYPDFKYAVALPTGEFMISAVFDSIGTYGLIKLDSSGNIISTKYFPGFFYYEFSPTKNNLRSDNNSVVLFGLDSAFQFPIIIKIDFNGNVLWSKKINFTNYCKSWPLNMDMDSHENILIACTTVPVVGCNSQYELEIVKIDALGSLKWAREFPPYSGDQLQDFNCNETNADKILFSFYHPHITELDSNGYQTFTKHYLFNPNTAAYSQTYHDKNVLIIRQNTHSAFLHQKILLTDSLGNPIWLKSFSDTTSDYFTTKIYQTSDGGMIFTGNHVLKVDSLFQSGCTEVPGVCIDTMILLDDTIGVVILDTLTLESRDTTFMISDTSSVISTTDICLGVGVEQIQEAVRINLYPNPANKILNVEIENKDIKSMQIFDLIARKIYDKKIISTTGNGFSIDISELEEGVYLLKMFSAEGVYSKQFIKAED